MIQILVNYKRERAAQPRSLLITTNIEWTSTQLIRELMRCHVQCLLAREDHETGLGTIGFVEALDRQVVDRDVVRITALGEVGCQLGRLQDRLLAGVG